MAATKVIFYDIASNHGKCNSPNTWKIRLLLNYKKIPYETVWLEYPEIGSYLKKLDITPHDDGSPFRYVDYTLPAITIERPESPLHIMNSIEIAQALDLHFPTPPAHVSSELTQQVEALMLQITIKLSPALIPLIPNVLNPVSAEYYSRERAKLLGISLPELKALMGERAWEDSRGVLNEFLGLLRRDMSGPFMLGDKVSHADFCLAACFAASERVDGEVFERLLAFDTSFQKLYDGCKEWMVRDSW